MNIRRNWRVVLLTVFLLTSAVAIFVPAGAVTDGAGGSGVTNLKYGIDLSGGTRIQAPVGGWYVTDVTFQNRSSVEGTVAANIPGVTISDVNAQPDVGAVEVYGNNVSKDQFVDGLSAAGISVDASAVHRGVTEATRKTIVDTIRKKVNEAGLSGGRVQQVTNSSGVHFIVIEMPNANKSEVEQLVEKRGVVQIVAEFPADNQSSSQNVTMLEGKNDFASVGTATRPAATSQQGSPYVPVTLSDSAATRFQQGMVQYGFTSPGGYGTASYDPCHNAPAGERYCLHTVVDGNVVYSATMAQGLASDMQSGQFANDPSFIMTASNMSEARQLQINLRAGALPAPLDLDAGTSNYLSPSLAGNFKIDSLITGIIAVLAVSMVVFLRYGDSRIAVPMIVTALSEVIILLGFAAAISLPLDLSHIAGFIAVIGTGVDDLIIIADEVMAEGDVRSDRVFRSRFRKAFWTIGAAAATTIIAMSPLAVLSLGDLQGFALVTILGVLIGVLVTRPAYGDILRALMTER